MAVNLSTYIPKESELQRLGGGGCLLTFNDFGNMFGKNLELKSSRFQESGTRDQGSGTREQGAGIREQGTGLRVKSTGNRKL